MKFSTEIKWRQCRFFLACVWLLCGSVNNTVKQHLQRGATEKCRDPLSQGGCRELPRENSTNRIVVLMLSNIDLPWEVFREILMDKSNDKSSSTSRTLNSLDLDLLSAKSNYAALAVLSNFAWCQHQGYSFRYVQHPSFDEVPPPPTHGKQYQNDTHSGQWVGWKKNTKRGMVGLWHAAERKSSNPYRRYPTYWKSYEIVQVMQDHAHSSVEWVLFLDTDAIVTNHSLTYRDVFRLDDRDWTSNPNQLAINEKWWRKKADFSHKAHSEPYFVFGKDVRGWPGVCAGVLAARNLMSVREKLCEWWWMPPTGKTDDQSQLNGMLLNGYNDKNNSFWNEHASILPASYLYGGKTVFHAAAGNGCDFRKKGKNVCLLEHILKNNIEIQLSKGFLNTLRDSVFQRKHNHNCEAHVCRAQRFSYPPQIQPSVHCPFGVKSINVSSVTGERHAAVYMISEPSHGTSARRFRRQLNLTLASMTRMAMRGFDVLFIYPDVSRWNNTRFQRTFQSYFGTKNSPTKQIDFIPISLDSVVKLIESSISKSTTKLIDQTSGLWWPYHKLAFWTLTKYDSIVYLNGGMVSLSVAADLFVCGHHGYEFLSITDNLMALSEDFLWLKPNSNVFNEILAHAERGYYSSAKGWYDQGIVFANHMNIPAVSRSFELDGKIKKSISSKVETSFQSLLFWYFHGRTAQSSMSKPFLAAQLDICVLNNNTKYNKGRGGQCEKKCNHNHPLI